jgi:hypothetical protein
MANIRGGEWVVGLRVIATEVPKEERFNSDFVGAVSVVTRTTSSFFADHVWQVLAVDLPFVVLAVHLPQPRAQHVTKHYPIDTRQYSFKKVSAEFVAAVESINEIPLKN